MANAWREHVKKTMSEMKAKAKDGKVMLKDVLKAAGKTYKKSDVKSTTQKKKTTKRKTTKKKTTKKKATTKRKRSGKK
ncbi:hypothetical protein N8261_04680 [Flavobacteriaceae bacterium]|nr:hypothetical protein [Flavobacteriaceae bacterium]